MSFSSLNLKDYLLKAVDKANYAAPTPIQEKVIPLVFEGHDVLAQAQTGTGKTAAFALPIIQMLHDSPFTNNTYVRALILTPTRELALQICASFKTYGLCAPRRLIVIPVIGGENIEDQMWDLDDGADIVVATPGRIIDLIGRKGINLENLKVLVLDEADKMLDTGFAEELDVLLSALPEKRQNLLFSATFPEKVINLSKRLLCDPLQVSVDEDIPTVEAIEQRVVEVNRMNRGPLLRHLFTTENWEHVLVFVASCKAARNLAAKLRANGIRAAELHGDLMQVERTEVLSRFKNRHVRVLVATDIACRGIDIRGLSHVVNFDLPRSPADYIHRIGRTGRAGESGVAVTFIGHEDMEHFKLIEKRAKIHLARTQVEGFELSGDAPLPMQLGREPVKGKRKNKKEKAREKSALPRG